MLARHYTAADSPGLDKLLQGKGDVRPDRDRVVCIGPAGSPLGVLSWRAGGIVHELRVGNGMGRRNQADALVNFAIGDSLNRPYHLHEAIFVCDTDDMARYVEGLGALEEDGKRVFTLKLRQ